MSIKLLQSWIQVVALPASEPKPPWSKYRASRGNSLKQIHDFVERRKCDSARSCAGVAPVMAAGERRQRPKGRANLAAELSFAVAEIGFGGVC
jgi:hypothetical protein